MKVNGGRIKLARERRQLTSAHLAERVGISPATLSRAENGVLTIDAEVLEEIATYLRFPRSYFEKADPPFPSHASFRSSARLSAKLRKSALAAGSFGVEFSRFVADEFDLPEPNVLRDEANLESEDAATLLRNEWGIGNRPIGDLVNLLEGNGIRVFSLAESGADVDAFSFWQDNEPFIFLNTMKSSERTRFDAAHELGHLMMHWHLAEGLVRNDYDPKRMEDEANRFASSFLMPARDVVANSSFIRSFHDVIALKERWGVSAVALAHRLRGLSRVSEWSYRSIMIELAKRGYRRSEPNSKPREKSQIWEMVFSAFWLEGLTREDVARKVGIPFEDFNDLFRDLLGGAQKEGVEHGGQEPGIRLIHSAGGK